MRTGSGEIFKEVEGITLDEYAKQKNASPLEVKLFKAYLNLSEDLRKEVIQFISEFNADDTSVPQQKKPISKDSEMSLEDKLKQYPFIDLTKKKETQ